MVLSVIEYALKDNPKTVDDMIACLVWCLVHADSPQEVYNLHVRSEYVQLLRHPSLLKGEHRYHLTLIVSAASFVAAFDFKDDERKNIPLRLTEEEGARLFGVAKSSHHFHVA